MIGVLINTYQSEKHIGTCLASLFSQHVELEVFIMDKGSTDRTTEIAQKFPHTSILKNQEVQVFLEKDFEYILILKPDTRLEKNALLSLLDTLKADSKRMVAQPVITMMDNPKKISSLGNEYRGFGISSLRGKRAKEFPAEDQLLENASGACLLVRPAAFQITENGVHHLKNNGEIWLSSGAKVRHGAEISKRLTILNNITKVTSFLTFRG